MKGKAALLLICILVATSCTTISSKEISNITEGAALLLVAIPVGIVTSPFWITKMIIEKKGSKEVGIIKVESGAPKHEVLILFGEPDNIYNCKKEHLEIWEYSSNPLMVNRRYMVFNTENVLHRILDKIDNFHNCGLLVLN